MGNLTEHVMINKWDDDINSAITDVGGDTYGSEGLPDYADIIRSQLVTNKAVGEGVYQDFLYIDENNQTSIYPWEGDPSQSSNAIQTKVVAESIKVLYDTMASTERFTVLLVDDFPTDEINLSAVYLVRSKCDCNIHNDQEIIPNTYTGCYYIKQGKNLKRIDIPEFTFNLNELFYLTRAEYDASLSDYVKEIEDLLRKKFGKYWDDDGFTLDQAVEEIKEDLQKTSEEILKQVQQTVDEGLASVDEKIASATDTLNKEFEGLEQKVEESIQELQEQSKQLDEKVKEIEGEVDEKLGTVDGKLEEINNKVDTKLESVDSQLNEFQTALENDIDVKFNTLKSEVDEKVENIQEQVNGLDQIYLRLDSKVSEKELNELQ